MPKCTWVHMSKIMTMRHNIMIIHMSTAKAIISICRSLLLQLLRIGLLSIRSTGSEHLNMIEEINETSTMKAHLFFRNQNLVKLRCRG